MQKTQLGSTDLFVSRLGLGAMKFGRNTKVKYPWHYELPNENTIKELLAVAKDVGINLLDTAPAYGDCENRLGKLLKGQRQNWILSTKVGESFHDGISDYCFTTECIKESVENSLKRLRTDYLDIVFIHSNGNDETIIKSGALGILAELKRAGKLRYFGMSTKTKEGGLRALDQSDVAMVAYNPDYVDEEPVLDFANDKKKGILVKKALGSGHYCLSGKTSESLHFALNHPGVSSVLIGTINQKHLKEDATIVEEFYSIKEKVT